MTTSSHEPARVGNIEEKHQEAFDATEHEHKDVMLVPRSRLPTPAGVEVLVSGSSGASMVLD